MKVGDVYVGTHENSGVYLLIRRSVPVVKESGNAWECLVLVAAEYWHEREGDIVRNTEEWLRASFVDEEGDIVHAVLDLETGDVTEAYEFSYAPEWEFDHTMERIA